MSNLPHFNSTWTLFLDRDGVINKKIENDYVKKWEEFHFLPGVLESLEKFNSVFGKILIVTNQQGIGKGAFTEKDLETIHKKMLEEIGKHRGRIDRIYFCPHLSSQNSTHRKPATGMGYDALRDFPAIDLEKSLIAGDSITDMIFGRDLGMYTVFIKDKMPSNPVEAKLIDRHFTSLSDFAASI